MRKVDLTPIYDEIGKKLSELEGAKKKNADVETAIARLKDARDHISSACPRTMAVLIEE